MTLQADIKVGFIGFTEKDTARFLAIFSTSRQNKRTYRLDDAFTSKDTKVIPDIVIVNTNENWANQRCKVFRRENPEIPVVSVGANPLAYHISGMLLASRVFRVLDGTPLAEAHAEKKQQAIIESTRSNIQQANIQTAVAVQSQTAKPVQDNKPTYHVLVVDDSEIMQKSLLHELGISSVASLLVDCADSGEQALECIGNKRYDFIFMDVMMPGIDGFEACTQIRRKPEWKKTPIIMLSAKTSPMDEVKGVMAGCTTYLTKPIKHEDFQKLLVRVMRWLENFN